MEHPFQTIPTPLDIVDEKGDLAEQVRASQFMARRAFEQLAVSNRARAALQRDHDALLAHCAELLDRCQAMQAQMGQVRDRSRCSEDEVAAWLKGRGWMVSRPITIEGEAI